MRKFIKASIIFSMIANPIMIIPSILTTIFWHTPIVFLVISAIYALLSIGVGAYALKRFDKAEHKSELKSTAILTLIFNNPLAGFLMLIMKDF
ncbi:MAG: hypothetical protein ACI4L6_02760 [Candidatus Onthoplasma sp.]